MIEQHFKQASSLKKEGMSTAATAAPPLAHPRVSAIDARHSPGPPSPSKEVRRFCLRVHEKACTEGIWELHYTRIWLSCFCCGVR